MSVLKLNGIDELLNKITRLSELRPITAGLKAGAAIIKGDMQDYPERRFGRQKFKTEKQRKFFFYALKNGIIEVPYKRGSSPRSVNLKQRWRVRAEKALTVILENDAPYAGYVHGSGTQARYHARTGWPTERQVLKKHSDTITEIVRGRILGVLAGRGETA